MAFTTISGASGVTSITGTSGVDTTTIVNLAGPVLVEALGAADTVQISIPASTSISDYSLKGGDGNDTLITTSLGLSTVVVDSFIAGNAGNDLIGSAGQSFDGSTVQGGQGNDAILVGAISTTLVNGNKENDVITVTGSMQSSSVLGGQGGDAININGTTSIGTIIDGALGNDTIALTALATFTASTIAGGEGDDAVTATGSTAALIIDGGVGNDTLTGGTGNDSLLGAAGNDSLLGAGGKDTLLGGAGNDTIIGGASNDSLTGNEGVDLFSAVAGETFSGAITGVVAANITATPDVIVDFTAGTDKIRVTGVANISAVSGTTYGAAGDYATLADLLAAFNAAVVLPGTAYMGTYGSGTSWTSILIANTDGVAGADGILQIGSAGQFATPTSAVATVATTDIIAI